MAVTILLVCILSVSAYQNFQDEIPNGNKVPHPCKANYIWHGVGHHNPLGGGTRNQFGLDFKAAGTNWTSDLCQKDSDGDGITNGEELGDPNCVWTKGDAPVRSTNISHPGICTQTDKSICKKDKSWVDCTLDVGLKNCDAIKEPETLNITIRFPETVVPPQETTYSCMIFNLPQGRDYHLVAAEPYINNSEVIHHILVFGCDPNDRINDNELNKVNVCNMEASSKCRTVIGGWTAGSPGYCIKGPMGFRFGGAGGFKQAAMQFHWNNPRFISNDTDSSGMTFYYTPILRENDAAILLIGQSYLEIPPGLSSHTSVGKCHSGCSKQIMNGPINVFWAVNHMHNLGYEMEIELFRNGIFYTSLTHDVIYNYDSPVEYQYTPEIVIYPGDEIVTTCKFKSVSRNTTTFSGQTAIDEMCTGFLGFYPAKNLRSDTCMAWKSIPRCDIIQGTHNNCSLRQFFDALNNNTMATLDLVKQNCRINGSCLKECEAVLKTLIKDNPCLSGDVYDLIRYMAVPSIYRELNEFFAGVDTCKAVLAVSNTGVNANIQGLSFYAVSISIMFVGNF